jgi:hypothetical protein
MNTEYKPLSLLFNVMILAFVLSVVCESITGATVLNGLSPANNGSFTMEMDGFTSIFIYGDFIAETLLILSFSIMIYRLNSNSRFFGTQGMRFTSGWAVGWFFVPIINMIKGYQVTREIWKSSASKDVAQWENLQTPLIIKTWWIFSMFKFNFIKLDFSAYNPIASIIPGCFSCIEFLTVAYVIGILMSICSCILTILLFGSLVRLQESKYNLHSHASPMQ